MFCTFCFYPHTYEELIRSNPIQGGVVDLIGEETRAVYGWKTAGVNPKTGNPRYYLSERGKEEYAKFLKNFNSLSPDKQEYYKGILPSLTEVPDVVDFDLSKSLSETWQLPSMQYLGGLNPKHVGGFNTYIKYKNFEFTTDWTFKTGHLVPSFNDYVNAPRNLSFTDPAFMEIGYSGDLAVSSTNRQRKYLNYWQLPGDETNVKRFLTSDMDLWSTLYSSDKYEKGDYLRLTNLSFSYRVNSKLLARYAIRNLQIGVNMRNLLTFTKYKGVDVATGQAFGYPVPREFNIKLSLGF